MKNSLSITLIIILIFLGAYFSAQLLREVEERTIESHQNQQKIYANQAALSIENFFEYLNRSLSFLSKKKNIIFFNKSTELELKNYFEAHINELKAVTRVSEKGKILYTYPLVENVIGKDISNQKHNAEIISTHKPVISDVFTTVQGYRAIVYAYPVFHNNKYKGSISVVISFDYIANKFLKGIKIGKTGSNFVLSEKGVELYCTTPKHVGQSIIETSKGFPELLTLVNKMLSKESGSAAYYCRSFNNKEEKKIAVFRPVFLENTFWSIAVVTSEAEILEVTRGFFEKFVAIFLVTFLLVGLLIYINNREKQKSRKLLHEKERKHRENLEELINERTKELKTLNKSLKEDIKKRKKVEDELKHAIAVVEKSAKIKSQFLAQISHEIRTPVNTILNYSTLLKEEVYSKISDDLKYSFTAIHSAGRRLIRTIDLILNMSDMQSGTHEYIPKRINLCEDILKNLVVEYKSIVNEKGVSLILNKCSNAPIVEVDTYTVNQIFANLIDNAVKYTHKGSITINCERVNENKIAVSVIDTGEGISEEYLPKIFDEFSQEDAGYTRKYDGSGLGLALVKKYCELNNAEIKVTSKKGEGSAFTVIFHS